MRTVTLAFLFCLTSSVANAQGFSARKPVFCDETKKIIKSLTEVYNEKPVWAAKDSDDGSRYSLFMNTKTGAWTLLQLTSEYACVLGAGEESKIMFDDKT